MLEKKKEGNLEIEKGRKSRMCTNLFYHFTIDDDLVFGYRFILLEKENQLNGGISIRHTHTHTCARANAEHSDTETIASFAQIPLRWR